MDIEKKGNEKDIEEIIALLDGYVKSEGSRLKIQVTEGEGKVIDKKYHHGRCDVGSPWAKGTVKNFDCL